LGQKIATMCEIEGKSLIINNMKIN